MKKILLLVFASMCWLARASAQTATVTSSSTVLNSAGGQITLTATITYPAGTNSVTGVTITNRGSGYTSAPAVSFVNEVGRVVSIAIGSATGSGGSGYSAPTVTLDGGGGSGATATATTANGVITGFEVKAEGTGYTSAPTVVIADALGSGASGTASVIPKGIGTGAAATATIDGRVASIAIGSGGSRYSAPTVRLDGGGTGATATASTNANGVITGFAVTAAGTGYTSAPTVVITDATGSDATGTASVANVVSAIAVTSPGSGYAASTLVMLTGNGTGAAAYASVSTPSALAFTFELPAGWALVSTGGANVPEISQPAGTTKTLENAYTLFPVKSATFTVTVSYPSGLLVNQTITPSAIYRPLTQPELTVAPLVFTPTPVAPAITTQPLSVTKDPGANATFTVVASGIPTPTLKWQRSTNNGATFADVVADSTYTVPTPGTLAIAATTPAMHGYKFRVIATSGDLPAVTSTAATLSVNFAPIITTPPSSQSVAIGSSALFSVVASGFPALSYQWRKGGINLTDGGRISGATAAILTVATLQAGDAGDYSVVVSNGIEPNATSSNAALSLLPAGWSATHAVVGAGYVPGTGATITITSTINYSGDISALGWSVSLPAGWSYASSSGSFGSAPVSGTISVLKWAWLSTPTSPVTFTYVLNIPSTESVSRTLIGMGRVVLPSADQVLMFATPDPLVVSPVLYHTADTNRNYAIELEELLRVIAFFNTRFTAVGGKVQTGCYKIQVATIDGFAPDPSLSAAAAPGLAGFASYHAADTNKNGAIELEELLRLIAYFNTRFTTTAGKVQTGFYKAQAGTIDGYAPDASRAP